MAVEYKGFKLSRRLGQMERGLANNLDMSSSRVLFVFLWYRGRMNLFILSPMFKTPYYSISRLVASNSAEELFALLFVGTTIFLGFMFYGQIILRIVYGVFCMVVASCLQPCIFH